MHDLLVFHTPHTTVFDIPMLTNKISFLTDSMSRTGNTLLVTSTPIIEQMASFKFIAASYTINRLLVTVGHFMRTKLCRETQV